MKSCSKILMRPLCFLILLGLSSFMILKLCCMSKKTENLVDFLSEQLRNTSFLEIENAARLLIPLNSSASSLARTLSSSLSGTELSFDAIQAKVAPSLFLALSTIPHVSHVSYIGLDGLMFLYYNNDDDGTFAVFSNSSSSSSSSYLECYTQPVDRDNGKLYGQAVGCDTRIIMVNITLVQESVNKTAAFSSLGTEWDEEQDLLFLYNVAMDGRGLISIGYPTTVVADHFVGLDFNGGDFHLATSSGQVLVESKLQDTRIDVNNSTVSVETVNMKGDVEDKSDYYSCKLDDGELSHFHMKIRGNKHIFYCSTLEIGGIESVYVLAFPIRGVESIAHKNSALTLMLLVLILAIIVVSVGAFIIMIMRSARREMFLCAALVKQMESTQQAERKSMNKSLAFASASHDIRASLAAITGLIDVCRGDAKLNSDLVANLGQMNTCAMDLLGILNSVLDTSKIEAGKMQLEEEEFNVAQLLEDVVDMFYPLGMKKGVDVVLDPSDGSILKFNLVRGDRGKLKQILCNLLSNATKFTSEGHISVRAMVRKTSIENAIIASNRKCVLNCLSRMCYKNKGSFSTLEGLHTVQENPNSMEYIFDVDDTGKGIPKERQQSVFENFVQVKETALGQGTGLGLGIVQSLVRLMGGEIKILDKEQGERGTCFRFNVFLTACHPATGDIEEEATYMNNDGYPTDIHHRFGMHVRSLPPRSDASHVILFLAGEERRKISKKLIQSFGVKVLVVKRSKDLFHVLERVKQRMDLSQFSSSEISVVDTLHKSPSNNSSEGLSGTKEEHSSPKRLSSSILIVIDANAAPVSELCSVLANFRKDLQNVRCKFVWLENPVKRNDSTDSEDEKIPPLCDHILSKPLHGSHLYRVLGLLPEFGGAFQSNLLEEKTQTTEEIHCSSRDSRIPVEVRTVQVPKNELEQVVIHKTDGEGSNKPLNGKNVLVVEDDRTLRMLSTTIIRKLGATLHVCENGKEAFDLVCETLKDMKEGALPFDYIFMDCKMPVMDGFEATRLIRKEEEIYGVHTPIIALTAYSEAEEISRTTDAGMDFHLAAAESEENFVNSVEEIVNRTTLLLQVTLK